MIGYEECEGCKVDSRLLTPEQAETELKRCRLRAVQAFKEDGTVSLFFETDKPNTEKILDIYITSLTVTTREYR